MLRGNGTGAYNGWPTLPKLEALRDEWLASPAPFAATDLSRRIQAQALQDVPDLPLGSYYQPVAHRANLADVPKGLVQFTGIRRT